MAQRSSQLDKKKEKKRRYRSFAHLHKRRDAAITPAENTMHVGSTAI